MTGRKEQLQLFFVDILTHIFLKLLRFNTAGAGVVSFYHELIVENCKLKI